MNTICGHDREAVLWALVNYETAVVHRPAHGIDGAPRKVRERIEAHDAVSDPAKLAELMAEELRRRDVDVIAEPVEQPPNNHLQGNRHAFIIWHWHNDLLIQPHTGNGFRLTMPQARATQLRLMQLPEGTPVEDVLKALEATS